MPEYKTKLINIIGGPGAGKTTISMLLFAHMKMRRMCVEYVHEYAKKLILTEDFNILNDQFRVTHEQATLFKTMMGLVDYIITDGSILHGLYYNKFNPDNTSNISKTEDFILKTNSEFTNINIFIERNTSIEYEQFGRLQSENEAKQIDVILQHLLDLNNIPYIKVPASIEINKLIDIIKDANCNTLDTTPPEDCLRPISPLPGAPNMYIPAPGDGTPYE